MRRVISRRKWTLVLPRFAAEVDSPVLEPPAGNAHPEVAVELWHAHGADSGGRGGQWRDDEADGVHAKRGGYQCAEKDESIILRMLPSFVGNARV